jgi:signal transduction histidine kinase/ABC-type amino acid transport substrate-binding protein/ActR/RegA family two-component response regulator
VNLTGRNMPQAFVSILTALLVLTVFSCTCACAAAGRLPVRVGFVEEQAYNYLDAAGKHHGYAHEIIYNIAMRAGLDIRYVNFANYDAEDAALKAGSIDLEVTVPKSAEREKDFLFSEEPTGSIGYIIFIRDNDDRYSYGDPRSVNGMKVAIVKGDATVEIFKEWCSANKLHPVLKAYPTFAAALAAVKSGECDGGVSFNATFNGFHVLLPFNTSPFFVMMNKKRTDLANRINAALREIMYENPVFEEELYMDYLAPKAGNTGVLTVEERKYLASRGKRLVVAVQRHDPPFSSVSSSGVVRGIIPDYYEQLSHRLGVTFNIACFDTQADVLKAVREGSAEIAGFYGGGVSSAYNEGLSLVNLSGLYDMMTLARHGHKNPARAAVLACDRNMVADALAANGDKNYQLQSYNDIKKCYDAFKDGEADCIICTFPAATWLVNNHRAAGAAAMPFLSMRFRICSAVRNDETILYSILNKSVVSTYSIMQGCVSTNVMPQSDLRSVLDRVPATLLGVFAVVLLVMVVSLIFLLLLVSHRHSERAALAEKRAENEIASVKLESIEKNNEERALFFSNISHDMRTPLNGIVGFTQLALKTGDTEQMRDYMRKIAISGRLLVDLIDDTLTISKLDSGKLERSCKAVDAGRLFEEVATPVRETAAAKGLIFKSDTSRLDGSMIIADELNVKKIFLNLLSNAVKYTPKGGTVELLVRDDSADKDRAELVAVVRDTGIGISADFLPRLYEPFTQEDRAAKMSAGTGLGMSIVKRLVDMMDGSISVKSEPGNGTEFTLRLSFQRAAADMASAGAPPAADLNILRGKKALLCEDNLLNREIAQAILQSKGITVISAADGREGVKAFADSRPGEISVVLMDIRMPNMDGYEACKAIRAMDRQDSRVPIIALTANAYEDDIKKCLAVGMDSHAAKPIDAEKLLAEIARLCARRA